MHYPSILDMKTCALFHNKKNGLDRKIQTVFSKPLRTNAQKKNKKKKKATMMENLFKEHHHISHACRFFTAFQVS